MGNKANRLMADAMSVATITTPLMACCEKLAGFESDDSRSARMTALMIIAAGYGTLINAGRNLAERICKPKNTERFNRFYYALAGSLSPDSLSPSELYQKQYFRIQYSRKLEHSRSSRMCDRHRICRRKIAK